jgi:hypothetical protein
MTATAPTWRSTEDLAAALAAIDHGNKLQAARAAVTAATAERDAKRDILEHNRGRVAGVTIDVPGASQAMAALDQMAEGLRAAEKALVDATATRDAIEADVVAQLDAIGGPACRAAAQRIVDALAEIESAITIIGAVKTAADKRRVKRILPSLLASVDRAAPQLDRIAKDVRDAITPRGRTAPPPAPVPRALIHMGGGLVVRPDDSIGYLQPGRAA